MSEFQVWATAPGRRKREHWCSFELERWQWAEKLYQYLVDRGYSQVEVLEKEVKTKSKP